ncbi:heme exporter protein CcmB [Zhaonella formicivorans]|jgi:heme exporter protein B|uniref:heme exporter protein CcmB n=1 Tax=Zhaonella formicivorans TaxID=2528593 RepID=UPI0010E7F582|nr:heme exporter protein CcmB [Zhaonella formicivorans]
MGYWRKVMAIVQKELLNEWHAKENISPMFIFAFLVIVIFAFAFPPLKETTRQVFPGIIWMGLFFACQLGLSKSFTSEKVNDCIMGLMLTPADRTVIFFGKLLANLVFTGLIELTSLPLFFILFDYRMAGSLPLFILIIVLGTVGFISIGTFLAALTSNTRNSEILLPLVLFPILVPVIIGAVKTTALVLSGSLTGEFFLWLKLLAVYDLIFLVVPFMLFDFVLEV